jgi:predicted DNA-binding protein
MKISGTNLMESISLKLPVDLLETSDRCARELGISRAEYIRRAIERMNREVEARVRAERMARASRKVRNGSMRVNAEFAAIERDSGGRTFKALLASAPLDGVEIRRSRDSARPRLSLGSRS